MTVNGNEIGDSCVFVLFGASGDLARRKLFPALCRLFISGYLPKRFLLVGFGRSAMSHGQFRDEARSSVQKYGNPEEAQSDRLDAFLACLSYVSGSYDDAEALAGLAAEIARRGDGAPIVYYLALPPVAAEKLLERFAAGALPAENARILMEKPFGSDLASAQRLNRLLARRFEEKSIHRIDHYLAKDTVRNLLIFRFANVIFEPLWNRHYIDHIQVSATEDISVENRGGFYDGVGVVRDMFQNHVLMLLALATMEPPLAGDSESIRDRVADLLKSIVQPAPGDFVFGQYEGYRRARNVDPNSTTPTFAALRLGIYNWRWDGVPIYLMSGKCLDARVSEIDIIFKRIPICLLESGACAPDISNVLTLRIHPNEGIRLEFGVKLPGHLDLVVPAGLNFRYADLSPDSVPAGAVEKALGTFDASGHHLFTGYERVLIEALAGRPGLFWRADGIEAAWKVVEPMLQPENLPAAESFPIYKPGTAGSVLAKPLFKPGTPRWHKPSYSTRA